jgi:hypothetical protein
VTLLCRVLGVSRSGFYDYLCRQGRDPDPEREEKLEWVKKIAEASDHTYGSRRRQPRCCRRSDIGWDGIRPAL